MGDAKRRAGFQPLTPSERDSILGLDPFKVAYDFLYGMVERVYTATGGVNHELIGVEFANGKPSGVNVLVVKRVEDVPRLRDEMLARWPMVAHVFEAWEAPDASMPAHDHPERFDIVAIMLHTAEFAATASCRVDPAKKSIERGELLMPSKMEGRLGRDLPARPVSS